MSTNYFDRVDRVVRQHHEWRTKECLNLIPSENRGSPHMRHMFTSDIGNRYNSPDKFYRGTKFADELVAVVEEAARKVFGARYADVRPLSGHTADMALLMSFTKPGDKIASVHPDNGGYPGITHLGLGELLQLENVYLPYDEDAVNVDAKRAAEVLKEASPKVVFSGASFIPFPHPVAELSEATDAVMVYDASHVLGLIAGGEFQDPLREGCSLMVGSTHKSFPGPQGGIILSNDEATFSKVSGKIFPGIIDNIHLDRVAALGIALAEMQQFGKSYAQAVIKNSKALGKALAEEGVPVKGASRGYSESHQVLLDYDQQKLKFFADRLEQANIIMDEGGRLGTSEATRMGYGPAEMQTVAGLVAMLVLGKKPADFVKKKVQSLVRGFQQPRFVLTSPPKGFE